MTVRIDTLRNRISKAMDLLQTVHDELEDLHVLAYDRPAAKERAHVHGGQADYALDTHGDPKARDAYRWLSELVVLVADTLIDAGQEAVGVLREGEPRQSSRRDKSADVTRAEFAEALKAQERRLQRGEYSPVRRFPQAG